MGFYSLKEKQDITNEVKTATLWYGATNRDGIGIFTNEVFIKSSLSALNFWKTNADLKLETKNLIFHVRTKTSGEVNDKSAHPFEDESRRYVLSHNGVLINYDKYREELSKRHNFKTEVDSEVLLYAFVENKENFVKVLREKHVTGSAVIIIYDKQDDMFYIYTNSNNMFFSISESGIKGASSADVFLGESIKPIEAEFGKLYKIKEGKIVEKLEVGDLYERPAPEEYYYPAVSSLAYQKLIKEEIQEVAKTEDKIESTFTDNELDIDFPIMCKTLNQVFNEYIKLLKKVKKSLSKDYEMDFEQEDVYVFGDFQELNEYIQSFILEAIYTEETENYTNN